MRRAAWWVSWALLVTSAPAIAEPCHVFVLTRSEAGLAMERRAVPSGRVEVWPSNAETEVVDVILPPGPGVSGSLVQLEPGQLHVLRCDGAEVHHRVQAPAGKKVDFPSRALKDLEGHDIRVSVTGGDGRTAAFLISGYQAVEPDRGPIQNLFAAVPLPMGPHDYIVTTDTYPRWAGNLAAGEARVELRGHPFVRVEGPGGKSGWFVVDLGAAETLVGRGFLPENATVEKSSMVEYSAAGRRLLDYAPGGATGAVKGIEGHASLPALRAGTIEFGAVTAAVIEKVPDLFDRPVMGILGIDVLSRASCLTIEFPPGAEGVGKMRLGPAGEPARSRGRTIETPFSRVSSHLFVTARADRAPLHFLVDTGAPRPLLSPAAARAAGVTFAGDATRPARGLDQGQVASRQGTIPRLVLGGAPIEAVECDVAPLEVFTTLQREGQHVALLGNSFLGRFERVEIEFGMRRIRFVGGGTLPGEAGPSSGSGR